LKVIKLSCTYTNLQLELNLQKEKVKTLERQLAAEKEAKDF